MSNGTAKLSLVIGGLALALYSTGTIFTESRTYDAYVSLAEKDMRKTEVIVDFGNYNNNPGKLDPEEALIACSRRYASDDDYKQWTDSFHESQQMDPQMYSIVVIGSELYKNGANVNQMREFSQGKDTEGLIGFSHDIGSMVENARL